MSALAVYSILLSLLGATNSQFLEQPDPGTVLVPVQNQISLVCSVEEGYVIDWQVTFPDGAVLHASNSISHNFLLMQRQFTLEGVATSRSTLSLRETETQTNNGTNITCVAHDTGFITPISGNTVQVLFYGPPPPPTGVYVAVIELGSLNISWSLGFLEGVPVNYTLTFLNLNTTSGQPVNFAGLLDQHYVFQIGSSCDTYGFTVIAVTAAGNSTPSQELTFDNSDMCSATRHSNATSNSEGLRSVLVVHALLVVEIVKLLA